MLIVLAIYWMINWLRDKCYLKRTECETIEKEYRACVLPYYFFVDNLFIEMCVWKIPNKLITEKVNEECYEFCLWFSVGFDSLGKGLIMIILVVVASLKILILSVNFLSVCEWMNSYKSNEWILFSKNTITMTQ